MKRFSRAVVVFTLLALFVPLTAAAAKKRHVRVKPKPFGKLEPIDWIVVDGLDYPVPRNISRGPGILPKGRRTKVGPPAPKAEVYTAVDPTQ